MDGEHRNEIVRDHLRQQLDIASRVRSARWRLTAPDRSDQPGWASGPVSVASSLTRRVARRPTMLRLRMRISREIALDPRSEGPSGRYGIPVS
jgi:hypothetical protein